MVSILDTPGFEVYLGVRRYKGGEKIMRGEGYTDCWEKVWEWPLAENWYVRPRPVRIN